MNEYVVEMKGIVKNFGQVQAVKHGEFTLKKGEIHSLIGENGAGKSTMMKLLYGMYPIDEGEIIVKGEPMGTITPKLAIEHGVGMVHRAHRFDQLACAKRCSGSGGKVRIGADKAQTDRSGRSSSGPPGRFDQRARLARTVVERAGVDQNQRLTRDKRRQNGSPLVVLKASNEAAAQGHGPRLCRSGRRAPCPHEKYPGRGQQCPKKAPPFGCFLVHVRPPC